MYIVKTQPQRSSHKTAPGIYSVVHYGTCWNPVDRPSVFYGAGDHLRDGLSIPAYGIQAMWSEWNQGLWYWKQGLLGFYWNHGPCSWPDLLQVPLLSRNGSYHNHSEQPAYIQHRAAKSPIRVHHPTAHAQFP